jgi:hypothetical protein
MMPGAEPLYSVEWDLVRAYDQTIQGQGEKKAAKKPRKKKTPTAKVTDVT